MKFPSDLKWIILLILVCFVVFANSVGGDFIYDDMRQIVRNPLIQDNSLIWKALTSDVWAFKGDGTIAASNYWRPIFTLWNIICFRLFGLNPIGWHIANIVLHSGVCVLAFSLLRRWAVPAMVAFAITLIFAVHPVHAESVSWIAGSPDLLFSLAFLGSLWFATSYRSSRSSTDLALTALLYAVALGSKEIGIFCLPIYYFVLADRQDEPKKIKAGADTNTLLVLSAIAFAYFFVRWTILGFVAQPSSDPVSFATAVMSVPEMFVFYLKQIFAPVWVAINYPLAPVTEAGAYNFVLPLAISVAVLVGIFFLARRSPMNRIAACLFLLPLIPAMNATAFLSEQLVHDRYLYLPLLGALMLVIPLAAKVVEGPYLLDGGVCHFSRVRVSDVQVQHGFRERSVTLGLDIEPRRFCVHTESASDCAFIRKPSRRIY